MAGSILVKKFPEAQFVIVGDRETSANLKALAGQLNCRENFKFLGHQKNVLAVVSLFDVFVCCSHSEGLGMSIAEAMASAKPVVGTRVGGIPEIVNDGVTGLLVEPMKIDQLAAAIEKFVLDPVLPKLWVKQD